MEVNWKTEHNCLGGNYLAVYNWEGTNVIYTFSFTTKEYIEKCKHIGGYIGYWRIKQ